MPRLSCDQYYNFIKFWMIAYIPKGPNAILDLGCATGLLGRELRKLNKAAELVGVEIFKDAAVEAEKYYDKIHYGDIEQLSLNYEEHFDFVICGDILEHLRDPWGMLLKIHGWLNDDGTILVSIPNIRNWHILKDLMLHDEFEYKDAGILDITHLRYYTRKSFINDLERHSFEIIHHEMDISGRRYNLLNKLTLSLFEGFLGSQIRVIAKKKGRVNATEDRKEGQCSEKLFY